MSSFAKHTAMPSVCLPFQVEIPQVPKVRKHAPIVVGPKNPTPVRPTKQLPADLIDAARATHKFDFDAKKHICFETPARRYTMEEWGYEGQGISPIASSDPFSLSLVRAC